MPLGAEQCPDQVLDVLILVNLDLYGTLVADDVEVLNQEAVNQDAQGNQAHADDDFADAWEVCTALIHGGEYAVQAVDNNTQNCQPGIGQETASGLSQRTEHNQDRNDDTKEHLRTVHIALESTLEHIAPQIHREQIIELPTRVSFSIIS